MVHRQGKSVNVSRGNVLDWKTVSRQSSIVIVAPAALVLVPSGMTFHAVLEIGDALLQVF